MDAVIGSLGLDDGVEHQRVLSADIDTATADRPAWQAAGQPLP